MFALQLPKVSRQVLGEDIQVPFSSTWPGWCGPMPACSTRSV